MALSRKTFLIIAIVVAVVAGFTIKKRYYYPITNKNAGSSVIVAFGDSLTYGTGARNGEDWPSLLSAKAGCRVLNKGVPGDTTSDALARLKRDVLDQNATIVIVGLGGNDILQRSPETETFSNLRTIVDQIQASGAMVVVLGLNGFPFGGSLKAGYADLARDTGSVLVPNLMGGILTNAKYKSDQIHPNAAGYKLIADKIYNEIKPYL